MKSIFNKADNESIIVRINSLTTESQPAWGKMTVDQMCKHCDLTIDVAYGKRDLKIPFVLRLLGRMLKKKMLAADNMGKGSATAKEYIVSDRYDLEGIKSELIANFRRFADEGESVIKLIDHPFWGKMTIEEWDMLMWKHMDHHLKQFGV